MHTGTYVVDDPDFGRLAFGGEIALKDGWISVIPTNSARSRVYLAPLGLWLTLDSGRFEKVEYRESDGRVRITLAPRNAHVAQAGLRIEQPARPAGTGDYRLAAAYPKERGAAIIPLGSKVTRVELVR
jgi:hypothetical protein